jgi:transcriptional regulator with GAF, ATPase, and Fis domain
MRPIVERIAASDISVLIVGETGVGKELLSRMVHEVSPRRDRPLLLINCATLQETLLESELFGHERGAFTGAVQTKRGILEAAEGGTLILDEIGEMPLSVQAKLLRVFEHQEVVRVGAVKPTPIDVRFVAATNRDLEREIERGTFRQDLYFRLNGITLVVPPLRERVGEIDQLAEGMVAQAARRMGREVPSISAEVKKLLKRYAWPGNLRELRNVLERAVVLCAGDVITLAHLPVDRMGRVLESGARPSPMPPSFPETPFPMRAGTQADPPPSGAGTGAPRLVRGFDGSDEERQKLVDALARCGGNQSLAAKMLGVSRRTLVTRIEQYGLPRPRKVPPPA